MNVWVGLTRWDGNRTAPDLEIVPRRVEEILPCGESGGVGIDGFAVHRTAGEKPLVRPEFETGDALLFDERLIASGYAALWPRPGCRSVAEP
jgi:hypothetical protein